jgi:hypothetical protein
MNLITHARKPLEAGAPVAVSSQNSGPLFAPVIADGGGKVGIGEPTLSRLTPAGPREGMARSTQAQDDPARRQARANPATSRL